MENNQKFFWTPDQIKETEKHLFWEKIIVPAYEKAKKYLAANSIHEEDFDMYKDTLRQDLEFVKKKEKELEKENVREKENRMLSTILNAIAIDQFENNEWMGSSAYTTGTTMTDKIRNHVDNITIFKSKKGISYLAMAVRMTYSVDEENSKKKLRIMKENIRKGVLSEVKYFKHEQSDLEGRLFNLPTVLVGCDKNMLFEVAELWYSGKKRALAEHPMQFLIFDLMEEEITYCRAEALSIGKDEFVDKYDMVLNNLNEVRKEKNELRQKLEMPKKGDSLSSIIRNDQAVAAIRAGLESIFKQATY